MLTLLSLLAAPSLAGELQPQPLDAERPRIALDLPAAATNAERTVRVVVDSSNGVLEQNAVALRSTFRTTVPLDGAVYRGAIRVNLASGPMLFEVPEVSDEWTVLRGQDGWKVRLRSMEDGLQVAVVRNRGGDLSELEHVSGDLDTSTGPVHFDRTVDTVRQVFAAKPYAELITDLERPGRLQVEVLDAKGQSLAIRETFVGGSIHDAQIVRSKVNTTANGQTRLVTTTVAPVGTPIHLHATDLNGEPLLSDVPREVGRVTSFVTPVTFEHDPTGTILDLDLLGPEIEFGTLRLNVTEEGAFSTFDGEWGGLHLLPGENAENWWLVANYTQDLDAPLPWLQVDHEAFALALEPVEEWTTTVGVVERELEGVSLTATQADRPTDGFATTESEGRLHTSGTVGDVEDILYRMTNTRRPKATVRTVRRPTVRR